jgi:hypothetical protein
MSKSNANILINIESTNTAGLNGSPNTGGGGGGLGGNGGSGICVLAYYGYI